MTIKPLVNQKQKIDKNHQDGKNQNLIVSSVRNKHRNVLNQLASQENHNSPKRNKRQTPSPSNRKRNQPGRSRRESPQSPYSSDSSPEPNNSKYNNVLDVHREKLSGYNSGDEHIGQRDAMLSSKEWKLRDDTFVKAICERGLMIKEIVQDGACLFRAIALQVYGDQDAHGVIRKQTMDHIILNRDYFSQFVTENITHYVARKRLRNAHGNHIEIQAISAIYNRPVELFCYDTKPTHVFNSRKVADCSDPLRLSYHRCSHYNAVLPANTSPTSSNLSLGNLKLEERSDNQEIEDPLKLDEEIEQTMFEDKLKRSDWEATNDLMQEQVARESYLQWCRNQTPDDNILNNNVIHYRGGSTNSTVTSTAINSIEETISISQSMLPQDEILAVSDSDDDFHLTLPPSDENDLNQNIEEGLATGAYGSTLHTIIESNDSDIKDINDINSISDITVRDDINAPNDINVATDTNVVSDTNVGNEINVTTDANVANDINMRTDILTVRNDILNIRNENLFLKRDRRTRKTIIKKKPRPVDMSGLSHQRVQLGGQKRGFSMIKIPAWDLPPPPPLIPAPVRRMDIDDIPGTSSTAYPPLIHAAIVETQTIPAKSTDVPLSGFYQSLLESSYAEDAQLSEHEMVQKALHASRMEFIKQKNAACEGHSSKYGEKSDSSSS